MWKSILPQSKEPTWTLVFHNVKIVGNGDILLCLVEFKDQSVSSITDLTNLKTIVNLGGVTKPTKKQTHHALKQKKMNYVYMFSNALTAIVIIRQTLIFVCSRNTGLTMNSTTKNILRSMKTGQNQFAQLQMRSLNDLWHFKDFFSKYSKKQSNCQYYSRDLISFQYCVHSRTSMVDHMDYSELH